MQLTMQFTIRIDGNTHGLTPWLPDTAAPVHPGVYQRNDPAGPYACWDGRRWRADADTPAAALRQMAFSGHLGASWRGLSAPAPQPCETCRGHGVIDRGDDDSGAALIDPCPDC